MTVKQLQGMEMRKQRRQARRMRHKARVSALKQKIERQRDARRQAAERRRDARRQAYERFLANPAKECARVRRSKIRKAKRARVARSHLRDVQSAGQGQLCLEIESPPGSPAAAQG